VGNGEVIPNGTDFLYPRFLSGIPINISVALIH